MQERDSSEKDSNNNTPYAVGVNSMAYRLWDRERNKNNGGITMTVLVACEESQTVCKEFRNLGHEAYSCDIVDCSGGHPEWHIKQNVIPLLNNYCHFTTMDGTEHYIEKWDLLIAHPPCTYLSNVCTRGFSLRCTPPGKVAERWKNRALAAVFFMYFVLAPIEKICIENPVGFMNTAYCKPTQIIEPYQFAKDENDFDYVTKRTCLWLKNLEKLKTNNLKRPNNAELFGLRANGKAYTWEEKVTKDRSRNRSKTFVGVARAMATQWGCNADEKA